MGESWLGGGICLGMYAKTTEYIRYMQRTVPKHPRQRRRMAYEGTSYRDIHDDDDDDDDDEDDDDEDDDEDEDEDDDDDDDDDERPRCRPLKVLRDEPDADDGGDAVDVVDDDDDEMMLAQGNPRGIRTP